MRTLIDIDLGVLNEYNDWEKANNSWSIGDYLHLKYDMNTAIAMSKLFFPNFIEKDGCIIADFRFNINTFSDWYNEYRGEIRKVEYMCNLFEVKDYFQFRNDYETIDLYNIAIDEFAKILKISWSINLKLLFPNKEMIVDTFDINDTTCITFYSK